MFEDLMGNMKEQQKAMRSKLAQIFVEAQAGDGAIRVTVNANREIVNISIDRSALDWDDHEQLEDFLVIAINQALEKAAEKEAEEAQKMIDDLLPPGLNDLMG
jgi:nucleoid-associated protein EbfC